MSDDSDDEFAVGPGEEMKQRFGWTAENWRPTILQAAVVPEGLRDLVPLAQRWGVTCDVTRHDVAAKAREADLAELSERLRGRHHQIEDWLYSPEDGVSSDERAAFQAMVVLELEECSGPGLSGLLDWALRYYSDRPSAERRERLASAYREVMTWGHVPHLQDDLRKARELLARAPE